MDGIDYYMGRRSAWHNLGDVVGEYFNINDIMQAGRLDWDIEKHPLEFRGIEQPAYGVFRMDKDQPYLLGTVGADYEIIHHREGFEFLDILIGNVAGAHYSTAGSLIGGRIIWGLSNLKEAARIKGTDDITNMYLLFKTAHDGTMAFDFRCCSERVVCWNTLNVALSEGKRSFKVRHTKNYEQRMRNAAALLKKFSETVTSYDEKINFLADRFVTRETLSDVLDRLFPSDENGNRSTRSKNNITTILQNFEDNDGNAIPIIRGTAYNLLNAVTEYVDHSRSVKGGTDYDRAQAAMFGTGDIFKQNAMNIIMDTVDDMPTRHSMNVTQATVQA